MNNIAIAFAVGAVALLGGSAAYAADGAGTVKPSTDVSQRVTDFSSQGRYYRGYGHRGYYRPHYSYGPRAYYGRRGHGYGYGGPVYGGGYGYGGPSISFGFGGGRGYY